MLKASSKGLNDTLHDPGGSEGIAQLSRGHAHHIDALRQPLKQRSYGIAHLLLQPASLKNCLRGLCPRRAN
jgi:hypothetical protein